MNEELLEKVLACKNLPTLPAVAMRVIELTSKQDVSMNELAETIQSDQGLATKILRTINSSFYGLSKKCSTISHAQIMLGLNGVKTLALGFSLVTSLQDEVDEGFDYVNYWRRSIYTAVAARLIGAHIHHQQVEETFLAGLLQDIGMIALYKSIGEEYLEVLREVGDAHHDLGKKELQTFELHHADIGAMLAERWKLPDSLTAPIRFHERPTAAPKDHQTSAKCIWLGNLAADTLTHKNASLWVTRFRDRAKTWFSIDHNEADLLLENIAINAADIARLLQVTTGPQPHVADILAAANDQLVKMALSNDRESETVAKHNEDLRRAIVTDSLTGLASRTRFDEAIVETLSRQPSGETPTSLLMIDLDGLHRINNDFSWKAGDAALQAFAERLRHHFSSLRGIIARCGGERFGLLLDRVDRKTAVSHAESFCRALAEIPLDLEPIEDDENAPAQLILTASIGLATLDTTTAAVLMPADRLINAADQALHAAQTAGGNCIRVFTPRRAEAA